jgi:hypothetical protein
MHKKGISKAKFDRCVKKVKAKGKAKDKGASPLVNPYAVCNASLSDKINFAKDFWLGVGIGFVCNIVANIVYDKFIKKSNEK